MFVAKYCTMEYNTYSDSAHALTFFDKTKRFSIHVACYFKGDCQNIVHALTRRRPHFFLPETNANPISEERISCSYMTRFIFESTRWYIVG